MGSEMQNTRGLFLFLAAEEVIALILKIAMKEDTAIVLLRLP